MITGWDERRLGSMLWGLRRVVQFQISFSHGPVLSAGEELQLGT